jgi:hypothetical protein
LSVISECVSNLKDMASARAGLGNLRARSIHCVRGPLEAT